MHAQSQAKSHAVLYYIHDPMCSWCWGFHPTFYRIKQGLPENIALRYLLGGLAPDTQEPMPLELQQILQATWRRIQQRIPGTRFNFDFWQVAKPRRSTYAACRAVIAARKQDVNQEDAMILAIQQAYYLHALNPSDDNVLAGLAASMGLDAGQFAADLNAQETQQALLQEIQFGQSLGARGFPSLILVDNDRNTLLDIDYNDADKLLRQLEETMNLPDY